MALTRRGFLLGILAAGAAPAIVHNPMRIWVPKEPEAWGFRLHAVNPDLQRIADAMERQMRDAMELANAPRMIFGQIDRFTIYESPLIPAAHWSIVQSSPRPAIKRPKLGRW